MIDRPTINELISLAKSQAEKATDKDYWNLSVAYLNLLNKNFKKLSFIDFYINYFNYYY